MSSTVAVDQLDGSRRELHELAVAFDAAVASGDARRAEHLGALLAAGFRGEGEILHAIGGALARLGPREVGLAAMRSACATPAVQPAWHLHLAIIEKLAGNLDAALAAIERALDADSTHREAWLERASLHLARNEPTPAARAYDRAAELGASGLELHVNRSVLAVNAGEAELAMDHALAAVALAPDSLVAQINAAVIEGPVRGYDIALARLDALEPLDANDAALHCARSRTLFHLKRFEASLAAADAAITSDPKNAVAHELRIRALKALSREAEAVAALEAPSVTELSPRLALHLAALAVESGQRDRAPELIRSALARDPSLACAWFHLAEIGACDPGGADIAAMRHLLATDLSAHDRIQLHFALGKAYEKRNEPAAAFEHFRAGNACKRRLFAYDVGHDETAMIELAGEFSAADLRAGNPNGNPTERPVFIVGMPRSGTTLVEQILATHPAIFGAGELPTLAAIAQQCRSRDRDAWPALAQQYLDAAGIHAGEATRIIDKAPLNFFNIGLIRMLFPQARIIHCRRDPMDTGLSCFSALFYEGHEYAYDLRELGRFIRAYEQLMEHWRGMLPAHRFLELDYESLVTDTTVEAQRLVAFCGVPWDASVLRFYETPRFVRTASKVQVREPIYQSSLHRSRAYGSALDPLREALLGSTATNPR